MPSTRAGRSGPTARDDQVGDDDAADGDDAGERRSEENGGGEGHRERQRHQAFGAGGHGPAFAGGRCDEEHREVEIVIAGETRDGVCQQADGRHVYGDDVRCHCWGHSGCARASHQRGLLGHRPMKACVWLGQDVANAVRSVPLEPGAGADGHGDEDGDGDDHSAIQDRLHLSPHSLIVTYEEPDAVRGQPHLRPAPLAKASEMKIASSASLGYLPAK